MSESIETYDPEFRPLLKRYAKGDHDWFRRAHQMTNRAYPAPTLTGNKAAYWIGKPITEYQHVPILAVAIPLDRLGIDFTPCWSLGSASTHEIRERAAYLESKEESVNPLGAAVLEFASSGPYIHLEALDLLVKICPVPVLKPSEY